jgi:hypothetical protein
LYGNIIVERSALSPTVGVLNEDRLGRYVLRLIIRFGTSAGNYQYYQNTINAQPQGLFSWSIPSISIDGNSFVFTPLNITEGEYSNSIGTYFWHDLEDQNSIFDANENNTDQIFFNLNLESVPTDLTAVQVTASIECYDRDGNFSQTLQDTIDNQTYSLYFTYGGETVEPAPSYDVVARSTFGRGSIDLGKTYIGELHENVGGIMVETSVGVFQTTTNWSTQRYDYDSECNQVGVREVLAAHYKPRAVERGNIVMRGNGVAPPPFYMFVDDDTTDIYQCINYRLASTPAELEVTLHKVGTDGQAETTTTTKGFGQSPVPQPGPGLGQGGTFAYGFNSGYDFNNDAAETFNADWSAVIGTENLEGYITNVGPGKGQYFDFQGDKPGYNFLRKIYKSTDGLADVYDTWQEIDNAYRPKQNESLRVTINRLNSYIAKTNNPNRSFIITWERVPDSLLTTYDNAQAAYSLRLINSLYTGDAIQVRNSSGTLLDIGFDSNGDLDTSAISTHIGSGNGTIATWYDQSGNGRDASQSTLSMQPEIASAGTIHTVNGKPAVLFANDYLDTADVQLNPNGEVNVLAVSQFDSTTSFMQVANQMGSSNGQRNFYYRMKDTGQLQMSHYYGSSQGQVLLSQAATYQNVQYIMSAEYEINSSKAYFNGSEVTGTSYSAALTNHSEHLRLGAYGTDGTQMLRGYIQEFIYFSNSTVLDGDDISNDVNDYYSAF